MKKKSKSKKENFFKRKSVVGVFALISLASGFLFIQKNSDILTGNFILNSQNYSTSLVSLIGLLLIGCSVVLAGYIVFKK